MRELIKPVNDTSAEKVVLYVGEGCQVGDNCGDSGDNCFVGDNCGVGTNC